MRSIAPAVLSVCSLCTVALADLVTLSGTATVDNQMTVSISTDPFVAGTTFITGNSWPTLDSGSINLSQAGVYYLHVLGVDVGRPAMFIGSFSLSNTNATFANGTQSLLTSANPGDWSASLTGFGGPDVGIADLGPNGTGPWGNFAPLGSARFIWSTGSPTPLTVYFSTTITVVPAPAGLAGFGLLALGATRRRR